MSYEINHKIGLKVAPEKLYETLTDPKKLAQWWTSDTRGNGTNVGGILEFWFGNFCQKFEVRTLEQGKLVRWKATQEGGMGEWAGTEITFRIWTDNIQTLLHFRHSDWKDSTDFLAHCSMKWATFLLSLKDLMEKGQGRPAPNDLSIDYN
ncbi:SRPBCC domain-containing protein [Leptospira fletcheri]|uniref:SRPBCC domain-containing protein n=1 Tax=Leptospira fletcheri TaxID=2484981 RepID=A0A4R9GFQ9_9LEPT|nr:SRPBCC domain-containing protein [Leptospira fletcheri]TGK10156.1 SRPBCC domain-containing protein [Leptospira fletcheri]